jgi:hypothetical protein
MAVQLKSLRVDATRERDGEWVEFPEHMDQETGEVPALKVRGVGYGPFQLANSIVLGRWQRRYTSREEPVPPEVAHRDNAQLYADHILLDWRGFAEPFDPDFARDWLLDHDSRPLHDMIRQAMQRVGRVQAQYAKDAAKNSERSSGGRSKAAEQPTG